SGERSEDDHDERGGDHGAYDTHLLLLPFRLGGSSKPRLKKRSTGLDAPRVVAHAQPLEAPWAGASSGTWLRAVQPFLVRLTVVVTSRKSESVKSLTTTDAPALPALNGNIKGLPAVTDHD